MNKKAVLPLILLLLVGFGLWMFIHMRRENSPAPPAPQSATEQREESETRSGPQVAPQVSSLPKRVPASVGPNSSVPDDVRLYAERSLADRHYDWKQPINFYGRVVDENNQPVAGATASFRWTDLSALGTSEAHATSDAGGSFALLDRKGKRMSVTVTKDGYYTPKGEMLSSYEYANPADGLFTPDSSRPVVFHLRKKGTAEPLIHGLKLFGSRVDGTMSYVDLVEGKNSLTPPGDLTVRCIRSERDAERKFDWTFTLGVPDGGLIESTNDFMFLAPEAGYQPSVEISHKATDPEWISEEKHKFFVRSRNGQVHARIEITIIPGYDKNAAFDVEWFLNPSGSRNLEFDPAKVIEPRR